MERRSDISPEKAMEETFQIPLVATLLFVITMLAIFYLGRNLSSYYAPSVSDQGIELTRAS